MNPRLKKIIAIVGLAAMAIFSVTLVMYFINSQMLGGRIGFIALACAIIGIICFFSLSLKKELPSQIAKENERQKIKEDYERALAEQEEQKAAQAADSTQSSESSETADAAESSETVDTAQSEMAAKDESIKK